MGHLVLGVIIGELWPQPTMLGDCWRHVRGYCVHCECCATTAWRRHQCTTCSGRPWSPDFCTAPRHDLDSVQLQTVWSLKRFCANVKGSATAAATLQPLLRCLKKQTTNFSALF